MSGHSKWAQIKRQKAVTDAKKSQVFSKLAKMISVAARKGEDINMNPELRVAIEKAKSMNMPADNIERAIKRGAGKLEGSQLENVRFEAYGPGGTAIIVEGITDNKNRSVAEIKHI
ncbi:YebC/PmpR family DNA-binding transcriptional regulator, partial [Patescibacteria group bacterium]|nr:YebC/PmpR family DNA-binding transcriptional regulator [Patescibacteria group bacterium]